MWSLIQQSEYIDFMCSFNFKAVTLPYLTWCTLSGHNDSSKRTDSSVLAITDWSPFHFIGYMFVVSWHIDRSLCWVEFEGLWSCQTRVFHKFGWVFHKFSENGEFYIVWFLALTAIIEAPVKQWGRPLHWRSNLINLINLMNDWCLPEILGLPAISRNTRCFGLSATQWFPKPNWVRSGIENKDKLA